MALNLRHQSPAEFAARFWSRVRAADKLEFCRLMYWLTRRLVAGDLTDLQARTSFNTAFGRSLTGPQWTNLRASRITPAHDRYAAILAEGDL
jgi:hypothetical protein